MLYLDASVVVPLLIGEPTTRAIARWVEQQTGVFSISHLVVGEVTSAISRRLRMGELMRAEGERILQALGNWIAQSATIVPCLDVEIAEAAQMVGRPVPKIAQGGDG